MIVSEAVAYRRSVRGFLDKLVDPALLRDIVTRAARAATGGNLQPWHVDIVHGESMARLKGIMAEKIASGAMETVEYAIYPEKLTAPYKDRRYAVGKALYAEMNIARDDADGRRRAFANNFQFFGAPAALFCTVDRQMGPPQWSDLGMYLQNVMLLAVEAGLATCAQECWAIYPDTVKAFLGTPDARMLFCGMAIGYEDTDALANNLRPARAPMNEWLVEHG